MTVWIVCNCEVFAKKESALALVRKLLEDGIENHFRKRPKRYRSIQAILKEDVELALDYWNEHRPVDENGTAAAIEFREAVVREERTP